MFAACHPQVRDHLRYVSRERTWVLHDREPATNWTKGRVTLLGDAAHPTLQYLAQGAQMAIEDGVVLAEKVAAAGASVVAIAGQPVAEGDVVGALQALGYSLPEAREAATSRSDQKRDKPLPRH